MALQQVLVPDIGDFDAVEVIEVLIKVGDTVELDAPLISLETDKATMEIPAPFTGVIAEIKVAVGEKVSEGAVIAMMEVAGSSVAKPEVIAEKQLAAQISANKPENKLGNKIKSDVYAGPAVRRLARELEIDLAKVKGTGDKGRITKEDLKNYLKGGSSGLNIGSAPKINFAKFGTIESKPLSRIKKLSGANLHRNWITIPHVTQFDEADITELEKFRKANKAKVEQSGYKLTPLVFLLKAAVSALKEFPEFNSSLDGDNLILKSYFHIGIAVDTPNGLVVPVIRDVDKKGLMDLAQEMHELSGKAREGKLKAADMQGGCFTISSLGGIGGSGFTPIINAPEVAILGVSKSSIMPKYIEGEFVPRLILPIALSYDHRVVDGAQGVRFTSCLTKHLADVRTLLL